MRSVVSLQRGTHKMTTGICFSSDFLLGERNVQIVKWQNSTNGVCGRCWETSESAVGWGVETRGGGPFRLSHWQSRRTGGSGVSARCRTTPYYHLFTGGEQVSSQSLCDVIAHLHLLLSSNKINCFDISYRVLLKCCLLPQTFTVLLHFWYLDSDWDARC